MLLINKIPFCRYRQHQTLPPQLLPTIMIHTLVHVLCHLIIYQFIQQFLISGNSCVICEFTLQLSLFTVKIIFHETAVFSRKSANLLSYAKEQHFLLFISMVLKLLVLSLLLYKPRVLLSWSWSCFTTQPLNEVSRTSISPSSSLKKCIERKLIILSYQQFIHHNTVFKDLWECFQQQAVLVVMLLRSVH